MNKLFDKLKERWEKNNLRRLKKVAQKVTYRSNPKTVFIVGGISVAIIISREAYIWAHPDYKGKQN